MKFTQYIKQLISTEKKYRNELKEIRNQILNRFIYICAIIGFFAILVGSREAYIQGMWHFSLAYILIYLIMLVSLAFPEKIPYRIRALVPLIVMYAISVIVMFRVGLSGVGMELLIVVCFITAILFGFKIGIYSILFSIITIALVCAAIVSGLIEIKPEAMMNSITINAWVTTGFAFSVVVAVLLMAPILLQDRLYALIENEKINTKRLEESREKYRHLVEHAPSGICEIDAATGKLLFVNDVICEYLGYSREELLGENVGRFISTNDKDQYNERLKSLKENIEPTENEYQITIKDGKKIDVVIYPRPTYIKGKITSVTYVIHDITERRNYERKLISSIHEKEVLIKEIHHRVKNNMQVISSLLHLQSDQITNDEDRKYFLNTENRIMSMGLVHEKLYQSENFASIDMEDLVNSLISSLADSIVMPDKKVKIDIDIKNISLSIEQAIPCLLILNELVTNAIEHAFINNEIGIISIKLSKDDEDRYTLEVKDNGRGLPGHFSIEDTKTLGIKLINALVIQLKGNISYSHEDGTSFKVSFNENS
jgi:PAS domain S-box-containing protein